jgi:hypothetical protein
MVDVETYHRSCGESKPEDPNTDEFIARFRITDFDEFTPPPTEEFLLLMPPTIYGFGFHDKQWSPYLKTDDITLQALTTF